MRRRSTRACRTACSGWRHQSCLLLTSRECPVEVARLAGETGPVRVFQLAGLSEQAGRAILQERGLEGAADHQRMLVTRYSGNPLALKLVAETIQDLFTGDTHAFLRTETPIFDDIRDVLDQQFERLSDLEQELLIWLAIEREPVAIATLEADLVRPELQRTVLEALRSLQRRALLERRGAGFTLQNVILEYVTDRLVTQACQELETEDLVLLNRHALLKAQAKEYVRQSQARLLLQPVARSFAARLGQEQVLVVVRRLLDMLRAAPRTPGYAAGNLLNLLLELGAEVQDLDFSQLCVWQAYARGARLPRVSFAHADLAGSVFTDSFRSVNAVVFCPDGQRLAAATGDGAIYLWQAGDGQLAAVYRGHGTFAWSLAASPDGTTLASGSSDQTVRIWDAASGRARQVLDGHMGAVRGVTFSPDGTTVASSGWDRTVRLWDAHSGIVRQVLYGSDWMETLAYSSDGTTIVSGGRDGSVRMWDLASGQPLRDFVGHTSWVRTVAFNAAGTLLASGGSDDTICLWNTRSGEPLTILQGYTRVVYDLAFSPDSALLVSGSHDQAVTLWDVAQRRIRHTLCGHTGWVLAVATSPAGHIVASGGEDRTVRLWEVNSGQLLHALHGHDATIEALAFTPEGAIVVSGSRDGTVRLWDVRSGDLIG